MTIHMWKDGEYTTIPKWNPHDGVKGSFAVDDTCIGVSERYRYGKHSEGTNDFTPWVRVSKKEIPPEFLLLLLTLGIE